MEAELKFVNVADLHGHPDNPRFQLRDDVVDQITAQLAESGVFAREHALLVRPYDDGYQIVAGHTRHAAAVKAGLVQVPCWVRGMDDSEAFMQLVLSNAQGELSPLEIGIHALRYVERGAGGRGKTGGLSEYARKVGLSQPTVSVNTGAGQVMETYCTSNGFNAALFDKTRHLYEISKAPQGTWTVLVKYLLSAEWTVKDTAYHVSAVREFQIPAEESYWLPVETVVDRHLATSEFSPATAKKLLDRVAEIRKWIDTESRYPELDHQEFRDWLTVNSNADAWQPRKLDEYHASLIARKNTIRDWYNDDWHNRIGSLEDGSVAMLLTDPPYGMEFQSDRRVDRRIERKHDNISGDDADAPVLVKEMLTAFHAKLKDNAHVFVFCHWSNEPEMRQMATSAGYTLRGSLIWDKQHRGMGDRDTTFAPAHERILHLVKGSPVLYSRPADVLSYPRCNSSRHPTEKPVDLLQQLITTATATDEIVADPFGGVASTPIAAEKTHRKWWACEIDKKYWTLGEERLSEIRG